MSRGNWICGIYYFVVCYIRNITKCNCFDKGKEPIRYVSIVIKVILFNAFDSTNKNYFACVVLTRKYLL